MVQVNQLFSFLKPNLFLIIVDGTPMHKEADDRVMQKMLEENILKVNYKSFTQIVILGSTNFVPFMQLSGSNRREVIEDLLDIRIFSAMNSLIKDKIRGQKDEIKTLDLSKDNIKDKVEMQTNFINELESQGKQIIDEKRSKIDTLLCEAEDYVMQNEQLSDDVIDLTREQENVTGAKGKLKKLNTLKGKMSNKVFLLSPYSVPRI
jgi:DNA repair exonuclease SbcCD ATPase subunit